MWKIEKFGKSLKSTKFGIILKNIFYRGKMKSGKFLKNMLQFGKVENSGKKCEKIEKFGKSLKSTKFGIILKNIFYRGKMKKIEKLLEFVKWKTMFEKLKIWNYFEKYFLPR